jgi:hypothetical protein
MIPGLTPGLTPEMSPSLIGIWWPCFICGADDLCAHREPELRMWMQHATPRAIATAWPVPVLPSRVPPTRATAVQGELFEGARWAV